MKVSQIMKAQEREQIKWFVSSAALAAIALTNSLWLLRPFPWIDNLVILTVMAVPIAAGIGILKYRLYDIDVVINRTLVYGPLTAILAGGYVAVTGLTQRLFVATTGQKSDAAIALTTLGIVTLFTPLKSRLQGIVDKAFKETNDPARQLKKIEEQIRSVVQVMDAQQMVHWSLEKVASAFDAQAAAVYLQQ